MRRFWASENTVPKQAFSKSDETLAREIAGLSVMRDDFVEFLKTSPIVAKKLRKQYDTQRHTWKVLATFISTLTNSEHREQAWAFYNRDHPAPKPEAKLYAAEKAKKSERKSEDGRRSSGGGAKTAGTRLSLGEYPAGAVWDLVRRTEAHSQYKRLYKSFPKNQSWHKIPETIPAEAKIEGCTPPELMGMDCEMGETTNDKDAVIGIGVADDTGETILDALIKPPHQLLDCRTVITGLNIDDFDDIHITLEDARTTLLNEIEARKSAIGDEGMVVMVGHALHHDLRAMKLDYWPVIDTSLIYQYDGLPQATPGLAALSLGVMNNEMKREKNEGHHSQVEDALTALQLAQHQLEHGEVFRLPPPDTLVNEACRKRLMIHRLPAGTLRRDVVALLKTKAVKCVAVIDGRAANKDEVDEIPQGAKK